MIYAYVQTTSDLVKHEANDHGKLKMFISSDGSTTWTIEKTFDPTELFGYLQFVSWTLLGFA